MHKSLNGIVVVCCIVWTGTHGECQMITAHRGASYDAPENTMAAFRLAWEQNADAIEGDFRLTKDRRIVCVHDANTQRTCGVNRDISSATLEELQDLDFGRWKDPSFQGERCCTLDDVLLSVPAGKKIYIELKSGVEIIEPLAWVVEKSPIPQSALIVIAFDEHVVTACKERFPGIKVHWLTDFKRGKPDDHVWRPTALEIVAVVNRCKADGVGLKGRRDILNKDFVQQLFDGGIQEFHVWTVDAPVDARFFANLGAIGITTNRPALIRSAFPSKRGTISKDR